MTRRAILALAVSLLAGPVFGHSTRLFYSGDRLEYQCVTPKSLPGKELHRGDFDAKPIWTIHKFYYNADGSLKTNADGTVKADTFGPAKPCAVPRET